MRGLMMDWPLTVRFLAERAAQLLPDDVVFLAILPKTSVGKLAKRALREQLAEHRWPAG